MKTKKKSVKIIVFLLIAALLFGGINFILRPAWIHDVYTFHSMHGIYEEPEDTIETLFMGTSLNVSSISSTELYENYGICAYTFGGAIQPMMLTYYWLEEIYKHQSDTLDTVVLEVSMVKRDAADPYYKRNLEPMHFSLVKLRALIDYSTNLTDFMGNLIPVLSYHENWKTLSEDDFIKFGYEVETDRRGYRFTKNQYFSSNNDHAETKIYSTVLDENAEPEELKQESVEYLDKIIDFCNTHDLKLVLMKIPASDWSSAQHNAVQEIAYKNGLDFIDFNFDPLFEQLDYNYATDTLDGRHANYYGATKITEWVGNYLIEECGNQDIRGEEKYAFMENELSDYHRDIISTELDEMENPSSYLSYVIEQEDYTIFLASQNDVGNCLTEEQRDALDSLGLIQLSSLESNASYLAVIDDGAVTESAVSGEEEAGDLACDGVLDDGTSYSVTSAVSGGSRKSSVVIDGEEYLSGSDGLNIVVYDKRLGEVTDTAVFDSAERTVPYYKEALEDALAKGTTVAELPTTLRELYLYNRMCENDKEITLLKKEEGEEGALAYLQNYWNDEEYDIYLSVKGDAAAALTDEVRDVFRTMGLTELAELEEGDSYLAVIRNGVIQKEERDQGDTAIETSGYMYKVTSGGVDAGNTSSIIIDGTEYSANGKGLNIVIYDTVTGTVVDAATFDTSTVTPDVP